VCDFGFRRWEEGREHSLNRVQEKEKRSREETKSKAQSEREWRVAGCWLAAIRYSPFEQEATALTCHVQHTGSLLF
jgi:hypothetical protein